MDLSGVHLPLTTPFDGDRVVPAALKDNIARYEAHGVAGYLLLGSTGEASLLEESEKLAVLRAARAAIPRGKPLIAGVGLESTAATVRLGKAAADCGADLLLVLTPFYFRSSMTVEALVRHFTAVADAVPVPILPYNVPPFTGLAIPPAVLEALAPHPNVAGLKDSSGDITWLLNVLSRLPAAFQVLCGNASAFLPALAIGAVGGILGLADVVPEPVVALFESHRAGDARAVELQKQLADAAHLIVTTHRVAGIKAAMDLRGLTGGPPRSPLLPLDDAARAAIATELHRLLSTGLLPKIAL